MKGLWSYHKIGEAKTTKKNYNYRTSPFLLRNQFDSDEEFEIPIIPKAKFTDNDFKDLLLIGFDRTKLENNNHLDRMVHLFLYDYKFDFCFSGIPKGSTVVVSTYMVLEHNNHSDQKEFFLKGYNEMLRQLYCSPMTRSS